MTRKRIRDVYGNWVWVDKEDEKPKITNSTETESDPARKTRPRDLSESSADEELKLEWKDYIALTLASLQTILLPIVIFILAIFGILIALAILR